MLKSRGDDARVVPRYMLYTAWYFFLLLLSFFTLVHAVPNIIRGRGCMLAPNTKQHITCTCQISLERDMPVVGGFTDYPKTSDLEVHKNRPYNENGTEL